MQLATVVLPLPISVFDWHDQGCPHLNQDSDVKQKNMNTDCLLTRTK